MALSLITMNSRYFLRTQIVLCDLCEWTGKYINILSSGEDIFNDLDVPLSYQWAYCTVSTDCSHLVMRDAHSSLALMFTACGDA